MFSLKLYSQTKLHFWNIFCTSLHQACCLTLFMSGLLSLYSIIRYGFFFLIVEGHTVAYNASFFFIWTLVFSLATIPQFLIYICINFNCSLYCISWTDLVILLIYTNHQLLMYIIFCFACFSRNNFSISENRSLEHLGCNKSWNKSGWNIVSQAL